MKSAQPRRRIPRAVVVFFCKAFILFVAWKLVYLLWLMPKGILDAPMTRFVGRSTVGVLNLFAGGGTYTAVSAYQIQQLEGGTESGEVVDIYRDGQNTLRVANACNGLEVMVLYLGFLLCYPGSTTRRLYFAAGGLGLIFLLNIIRCAALVGIYLHHRQLLDFSHHFAFTFIVYLVIFLLWYLYTRGPRPRVPGHSARGVGGASAGIS